MYKRALLCSPLCALLSAMETDIDLLAQKKSIHWIIDIGAIQEQAPEVIAQKKPKLIFTQKDSQERADHTGADTNELLRSSNNNIMRAIAQTFANVSSIASMSGDQWKRTVAFMAISGTFSITQLALQAYLSSRSCS
jgi:UDP-N-acetylglucosamine 2-epimerase